MSDVPASHHPVTLDNCDREPIHVPGSIQPVGALLAFDTQGALVCWSANATSLLGVQPAQVTATSAAVFGEEVQRLLQEGLAQLHTGDVSAIATEVSRGGRDFDFILHGCNGRLIAEFEIRDQPVREVAEFALKAHRLIDRLKRLRSIEELLGQAAQAVRSLTGFDRVMAYRFRHDDSGEVVAEARRDDLEPYVGRRYPASDIPAQARRLYTLNTLRVITDVSYTPVPLESTSNTPLDLSYAVLRSVSPIHIEYLQNMGVAASMSVSILIDGRLWGMLACHHLAPLHVPYSIRMACDVLAQVIAANVIALRSRERAARSERAANARAHLVESLLHEEDVLRAIGEHGDVLRESLGAEAVVATQFGKVLPLGPVEENVATRMVEAVRHEREPLFLYNSRGEWPEVIRESLGPWVGVLALQFDPSTRGALLALRREQIETIRWGGKPEKLVQVGPLGPRLTPRGSFEEWREEVRGVAEPWDETDLGVARQLLAEMQRVSNARYAETERARTQLLAILGHDLRDPLQSIAMAAAVLKRGAPAEALSNRIQASSSRMQRLIGLVLDVSRIETGMGLGMVPTAADLSQLVADIVEEARVAHPGMHYVVSAPPALQAMVDRDRISQLLSNLISNARHHGRAGEPIRIALEAQADRALLRVMNVGDPIPRSAEESLFFAFKDRAYRNERNPTGLGLGLHIARQIVVGHGGQIRYLYEEPHVVFAVELPLGPQ
jgi:two-component system, chemotaxis family, sensor kinase Cph1